MKQRSVLSFVRGWLSLICSSGFCFADEIHFDADEVLRILSAPQAANRSRARAVSCRPVSTLCPSPSSVLLGVQMVTVVTQPGRCWAPGRAVSTGSLAQVRAIGEEAGAAELRWRSGLASAGSLGPRAPPPAWATLPPAGRAASRLELCLLSPNGGPRRRSDSEPGGAGSTWLFFLVIVDL